MTGNHEVLCIARPMRGAADHGSGDGPAQFNRMADINCGLDMTAGSLAQVER